MQRVISRVHQIVTTHSVPGDATDDPSPRAPPATAPPAPFTPSPSTTTPTAPSPSSSRQREISLAVERLQFATLLGERKKAIKSLRELARSYILHGGDDDTTSTVDLRGQGTPDHAALGDAAVPVVLHALVSDPRDTELMEAMLELLQELVAASPSTALALLRTPQAKPSSLGSSLRAPVVSGTQICLQMLQDPSPWIRGPTITLVKHLQDARQSEFAASVLECKEGLRRLLEVVEDKREHIRDAALQVLVKMTEKEKNVQQFLAFEDGFVRLFAIMEVEGLVEGSSVVSDCLQIVTNMLRDNLMNQTLFRDLPFLTTQLPRLLALPAPATTAREDADEGGVPSSVKSNQKKRTMKLVLQLVRFLVAPLYEGAREGTLDEMAQRDKARKDQELSRIQSAITSQRGLMGAVAEIVCCGNEDLADLQLQALDLVQLLSQGNGGNQIILVNLQTTPSQLSLLSELIKLDIAHEETPVAAAATNLLDVLFTKNESARMAIFQHINAPPPINDDENEGAPKPVPLPAGRVLIDTLITNAEDVIVSGKKSRKSAILAWKSCHRFAFLIANSSYCKELALRVPREFDNPEAQAVAGDLFLSRCLRLVGASSRASTSAAAFQVKIAVLTLLIQWCNGCTNAVREIIGSVTNLSALVDAFSPNDTAGVEESKRIQLEGLIAVLLGCCLEYLVSTNATAPGAKSSSVSPPTVTRQKLLDLISRKIGLERFTNVLVQFQQAPQFISCGRTVNSRLAQRARMLLPDRALFAGEDDDVGDGYLFPLYDRSFTVLCRELAEKIQGRILSIFTGAGEDEVHTMGGGGVVPSAASAYQDLIRMQDKQIHELQREVQGLKEAFSQVNHNSLDLSIPATTRHDLSTTTQDHDADLKRIRAAHDQEKSELESTLTAMVADFKALENRFHGVTKALAQLEADHSSCQQVGSRSSSSASTTAMSQVIADLEREVETRRRLEEDLRRERQNRAEAEKKIGQGTHAFEMSALQLNQQIEDLRTRLTEKEEQLAENNEMLEVFRHGQESAKRSAELLKQKLEKAQQESARSRSGSSHDDQAITEAAAKEMYQLWEKERNKVRELKAQLEQAQQQKLIDQPPIAKTKHRESTSEDTAKVLALEEDVCRLQDELEGQKRESDAVTRQLRDTVATQLEDITQLGDLFEKMERAATEAANHIAAKDEALLEMTQRMSDLELQVKDRRRKSKKTIGELEDEIARMFFEKTEAQRKSKASLKEAENELARVFLEKVELEKQLAELREGQEVNGDDRGDAPPHSASSSSASSSFSVGERGPAMQSGAGNNDESALEDVLVMLASMEIQCTTFRETLEQAKGSEAVRAAVELSRKRGALIM